MAAFVISYDLNKGDRDDYEALYEVLKKSGAVRATESSWFFASPTWTAIMIGKYLKKLMHANDVLTVNVLSVDKGFYSAKLQPAAVTWMHKHLTSQQTAIKKS